MDENERAPLFRPFSDPMTRGERLAAWIYLPLHAVGLPLLLSLLLTVWPDGGLTETDLNVVYYALGTVYMLAFLWRYFRRALDALLDNLRGALAALGIAYLIDLLLSWAVQLLVLALGTDLSNPPNNEAVLDMADTGFNMTFALAVFLAPMVEEPLFRGAVFGSLYRRSRWAAYAVSAALFSLYHVWQFAAAYGDPTYLIYALAYVPVSLALAFAYERSGSIWVPIAFHMTINAVTMYVLK